ncbi:MAG: hypothetical protein KDI51_18245 [Xanthomonadales bacterium]|nr:hypothetical protein [Xanthomonadales bacterium]
MPDTTAAMRYSKQAFPHLACVNWAKMLDSAAALALAEQVSETARTVGFETALIGATALAVHRYTWHRCLPQQ